MLTEKDYCDKDLTAALKDLGFPTKMVFMGEQATIEIPINSGLIQLYEAQKFLREEKKIYVEPYYAQTINHMPRFRWRVTNGNSSRFLVDTLDSREHYHSYEEALSEGIKEAVKILKENDNKD